MQDLLRRLDLADLRFLAGVLETPFSLTEDARMRALLDAAESGDAAARASLERQVEKEIRYLGSSEILYWARTVTGREPGVPLEEIVRDVAKQLEVSLPRVGTLEDHLVHVAQEVATRRFAALDPDEQQRLLEELGVEREKAAAFLKRSAGVFALPLLLEAFNAVVVQGLIRTVIFGTIARVIGSQLAGRLFAFLAARLPWWVTWIGPAAWTLSLSWTAFDLQGPATRKTVPAVLYLGLCVLRLRQVTPTAGPPEG